MGEGPMSLSTWMGIPLKHVSLVMLTAQYSIFILLLHYSRVMPLVDGRRYLTSTAVFMNEVIKLSVSLTVALYDVSRTLPTSMPATALFSSLGNAVFSGDSWKLAIPAILYTLANSLQYIGISNLDAATFQVTHQLKVITTALFSVALLGRRLSLRKWFALVLLMGGVVLVQLPSNTPAPLKVEHTKHYLPRSLDALWKSGGSAVAHLTKRSATYEGIEEDLMMEHPRLNASIGLLAVIGASIASGLAGVYTEMVLKDSSSSSSVWVRNVQLAFYSLFPALFIGVAFVDGEKVAKNGFFDGYNWVVWSAVSFQAFGGIIVAFCLIYADNIAKNFATSISIIISSLASFFFFDFNATGKVRAPVLTLDLGHIADRLGAILQFLIGTSVVIFATYLYSTSDHRTRPSPPIRIHTYEKTTIDGATPEPQDFSIKLPTTPLKAEGLSTSRPGSPNRHHSRVGSSRGYFGKHRDE